MLFIRFWELDTARARFIVSSSGYQTACTAKTIPETRWGLGLDKEHFPEANILRYSLIQYTGGMIEAESPQTRWM